MNEPELQEEQRRPMVVDADYVPSSEAQTLPRAREQRGAEKEIFSVLALAGLLLLAATAAKAGAELRSVRSASLTAEYLPEEFRLDPGTAFTGQRSVLGLASEEVSAPVAEYYSGKGSPLVPGVGVVEIEPKGAAAEAGLLPGDVITAVNELPVKTPDDLDRAVFGRGRIELTVYRDGEYKSFSAVLAPGPRR